MKNKLIVSIMAIFFVFLQTSNVVMAESENYIKNNISLNRISPKSDSLGFKSINIIGDSISHGANAPKIWEDSWTSILRKSIQLNLKTDNHGFVSMLSPLSNAVGRFDDMIYYTNTWTGENTTDTLGFYKRTSSTVDQAMQGWIQDTTTKIKKIGIGVIKNSGGGTVDFKYRQLKGNNKTVTLNLYNKTEIQDIIWIDTSALTNVEKIEFINRTGTNAITGVYLINDLNNITLNNYSRSGAKIEDLSDSLIDKLFNTNVVIFALGHNSTPSAIDSYLAKCKKAYDTYKPIVYVVDLTWTEARKVTGDKLKQFAQDCNGMYIEIIPRVTDTNTLIANGFLSDVSHPSVNGHKLIAKKVLTSIQTSIISK